MSIRYSERLGEAGINPSVGNTGSVYDNALAETINGLYKTKVIRRRTLFPGQRFPVQHMDAFGAFSVPRWLSSNDTAVDTFCAVLDRVGPCIVLAHSHGGEVAFRAAARRADIIRGIVAVEPSGFCHEEDIPELGLSSCLFVYGGSSGQS